VSIGKTTALSNVRMGRFRSFDEWPRLCQKLPFAGISSSLKYEQKMNYVSSVHRNSVEIMTNEPLQAELLGLGAHIDGASGHLPFCSKAELAVVLTALQCAGFLFADEPAGWPPAAVFRQLRDEGLVDGTVRTISWASPRELVFREA
jgi:hypothetical protein